MTYFLTENQSLHLHADLIEEDILNENERVIYTAIFDKNRDEHSEKGCIIKKIHVVKNGNKTTTTIQYASGNAREFLHKWDDRAELEYRYSNDK